MIEAPIRIVNREVLDAPRLAARANRPVRVFALALLALPVQGFDLEGHRGARGLAPENTLAVFRRALAIGVSTLETDLAVTKDGVLVISHDPFLNPDVVRMPDGWWLLQKGPAIHTLTRDELKRYDIGRLDPGSKYAAQFPAQQRADAERFPTLAELVDLVKDAGVDGLITDYPDRLRRVMADKGMPLP